MADGDPFSAENVGRSYRRYNSATRIQNSALNYLYRRNRRRQIVPIPVQEDEDSGPIGPRRGPQFFRSNFNSEEEKEEGELQEEKDGGNGGGGFFFPSDEEDAGVMPTATGVLGRLPAQTNHAYGQITCTSIATGDLGDNDVPIYNFSVQFQVQDNMVDINQVQRAALRFILDTQPIFQQGQSRSQMYGQVRLLRIGNMSNDLVTAMVPLTQIGDEFEVASSLFAMSEDDIDPRSVPVLEFRYTFVLPEGRRISPAMVNATTTAFRNTDSRGSGRAPINFVNTQARFMAMERMRGHTHYHSRQIDTPLNLRRAQLISAQEDRAEITRLSKSQAIVLRRNARDAIRQRNRRLLGLSAAAPANPTIPKRTLTAAQRTAYNAKRRQKYHEQSDTRGIYQDFKRRIFFHTSLDKFFEHSKAVMVVPNTQVEGLCLAMALLRSEQRVYDLDTFEILESIPLAVGDRSFRTFPLPERVKESLRNSAHFSFLSLDEEGDYEGVLFNTFKPMRRNVGEEANGALKYSLHMEDDEIQSWYLTAQGFVAYITDSLKEILGDQYEEIDPNKEESFLQAVADVLDIHICIYRAELQALRCNVYKPQFRDEDIRKHPDKRVEVVSIFVSGEHASSITNLREFVKNRSSANRMHIQNYCLLCEKVTTANNCNIEACKKHFKECLDRKDGRIICQSESNMKKQYIKVHNPPQFIYRSKFKDFMCRTCRNPIEQGHSQMDHVCYITKPDKLDVLDESSIVVYDFEAAQVEIPDMNNVKQHDVNLVCCRQAYVHPVDGDNRQYFMNIDDFMTWVLSQTTSVKVYIAHNGGRYDVQFVMRYLERNLIPHSFIPAPSSVHAYLSVTIPFGAGNSATFLDFRNFMPASLKSIGVSFGLSVSKGDFPHHFNNGWRDLYEGCIPPLDDPRDFWCMSSKRTEEEVTEFHQWYASQCVLYCTCNTPECTCGKIPWNFQQQLLHYCWLDVDVLAEAVVRYRDNAMSFGTMSNKEDNCGWEPKSVDPYTFVTIPQMAMKLLLSGLPEHETITITPNKVRVERSNSGIAWMERISEQHNLSIKHIGNSNTEYYCLKTNRFLDGYCASTGAVFVCLNCIFHGCPNCFHTEIQTGEDHLTRPGTFSAVHADTKLFVETLFKFYGANKVVIKWECEVETLSEYEKELGDIMKERDCFYGGRTEAFSPYTNAPRESGKQIKYKDVCSLYPFVCAHKRLPTGDPEHICGRFIDRERLVPDASSPYFGFVKCRIIPNRQDLLGLLPRRCEKTGRLEFPLNPWIGCFGTEELRLAVEHGYVIADVFEVYHWTREQSSDTSLRGYVSFFLRMKQEAEGWKKLGASSENPSEDEKEEVMERVFVENGRMARVRKEMVIKDATKRQLAKIFLNSLWGKFCQKPHKEHFVTIHGYKQFVKLWFDPTIERGSFSFRHLHDSTWKVMYRTVEAYTKPNPKYNIFLAAKVTEWARTILHTEMFRIGPQNVLYCDTDSIMYICDENEHLPGHGLGEWVDEYPNDRIVKLYVLAPKFYFLLKESGESLLKSKGVQLTLVNTKKINEEKLISQVVDVFFPVLGENGEVAPFESYIEVDNMIMGVNSTNSKLPYGCMLTRFTDPKKVRPVYSKRHLVTMPPRERKSRPLNLEGVERVYTSPKGYHVDLAELARQLYRSLLSLLNE